MSVAELKAQAGALSFEQLSELAHELRIMALRKDPRRLGRLENAQKSGDWIGREEFEYLLNEQDQPKQ
jgi:hypothetical protein